MAESINVVEAKICLLGDQGVGKSSIVGRFVHGSFNPKLTTTLGACFMAKTIMVDGVTYRFQIWDTAGQERYRSLLPMYYRNAAAAIVVYDITEPNTFQVLKTWMKELKLQGPDGIVVAIAGNKSDLENKRAIDKLEGEEFAEQNGAIFAETSALNASNVDGLFVEISRRLPRVKPLSSDDSDVFHIGEGTRGTNDDNQRRQTDDSGGCCGWKKQ